MDERLHTLTGTSRVLQYDENIYELMKGETLSEGKVSKEITNILKQ